MIFSKDGKSFSYELEELKAYKSDSMPSLDNKGIELNADELQFIKNKNIINNYEVSLKSSTNGIINVGENAGFAIIEEIQGNTILDNPDAPTKMTSVGESITITSEDGNTTYDCYKIEALSTGKNLLKLNGNLRQGTIEAVNGNVVPSETRVYTVEGIKTSKGRSLFLKRINTSIKVAIRFYKDGVLTNKTINGNGSFISDKNIDLNTIDNYDEIKLVFAKEDDSNIVPEDVYDMQVQVTTEDIAHFESYQEDKTEILSRRGLGSVDTAVDKVFSDRKIWRETGFITIQDNDIKSVYREYQNFDLILLNLKQERLTSFVFFNNEKYNYSPSDAMANAKTYRIGSGDDKNLRLRIPKQINEQQARNYLIGKTLQYPLLNPNFEHLLSFIKCIPNGVCDEVIEENGILKLKQIVDTSTNPEYFDGTWTELATPIYRNLTETEKAEYLAKKPYLDKTKTLNTYDDGNIIVNTEVNPNLFKANVSNSKYVTLNPKYLLLEFTNKTFSNNYNFNNYLLTLNAKNLKAYSYKNGIYSLIGNYDSNTYKNIQFDLNDYTEDNKIYFILESNAEYLSINNLYFGTNYSKSLGIIQHMPRYLKFSETGHNLCGIMDLENDLTIESINNIVDQFVVETATYALTKYEEEYNLPIDPQGITIEERRSRIKAKMRSYGVVNNNMIQNLVNSWTNATIEIINDYANYTVTIKFVDTIGIPSNMQDVYDAIAEIKPAHLIFKYEFKYNTVKDLIAKNYTVASLVVTNKTVQQVREEVL